MRFAALLAAVLVLFACGESTSPEDLVGTYALTTVGGQPLPYILDVSDLDTTLLTGSVVRLNGDDSWLGFLMIEHTVDGAVHTEGATGTWTLSDTALALTETPGVSTYAAALSGGDLVVWWDTDQPAMVYEKTATDNAPPTVQIQSPSPGTTPSLVQVAPIRVWFNETMDPRDLTTSAFTLTGPGGPVAGDVDIGENWGIWKFEPTQLLRFGAQYTARMAGTVSDLAGNPLGADVTWSFTLPEWDMEFVLVPAGTFEMGDQFGTVADELPVHTVTLTQAFYLGTYEVTQDEWRRVMGTTPANHANCDDCPVEQVSWEMVQQFIAVLNTVNGHAGCTTESECYRLPTEAEWEYAAKGGPSGGDGTEWAGSNTVGDVAWYSVNSSSTTHPVGQKAANGLGLYDVSGNVWEWVQDWYDGSYYSTGPGTNPKGPASGTDRVLRGGSWEYDAFDCRVAMRTRDDPSGIRVDDGFRLLRVQ